MSISRILIRRTTRTSNSRSQSQIIQNAPAKETQQKQKEMQKMRFMMLVKHPELSGPPPKELMDAIGKLTEEANKNGTMVTAGGLSPVTSSTHVRVAHGKVTTTDGPFSEAKEVIGGFAIFDLKSKQEAIEGAQRFMDLHRKHWPTWEGETEIRQIFGPEGCPPRA
jgi:hypothetical protein